MAFKDENGRITIDEVAAARDVKNLNAAKEQLQEALDCINQILAQSAEFSGTTGATIRASAEQLVKQITSLMAGTDRTAENINQTVRKYQIIDKNLKTVIDGFGNE